MMALSDVGLPGVGGGGGGEAFLKEFLSLHKRWFYLRGAYPPSFMVCE